MIVLALAAASLSISLACVSRDQGQRPRLAMLSVIDSNYSDAV